MRQKIIESDSSENKENTSEDVEKVYIKEDTFVDTDSPSPTVVSSSQQDQNCDDSKIIVPLGEFDPQESMTTLLQEEETGGDTSGKHQSWQPRWRRTTTWQHRWQPK